jgi:two-component system chemotaxis family response regulator WspR
MSAHQESAQLEVRPVVLLVEDQPSLAEWVLQTMRADSDVRFYHHSEAATAVARALEVEPTAILQDLTMRGVSRFELIRQYRAAPALANIPVIVLFAASEIELAARAFQMGATDYVVKAPYPVELMPRIRAYSTLYLLQRERAKLLQGLQHTAQQLNDSRAQLAKVPANDPLTGLANAHLMEASLTREWKRAARDKQPLSLAVIEIDFFRQYEQRYGVPLAEQCLRKLVEAVVANARRPADLAARSGPDRFIVLLPQTHAEGAVAVGSRVREAVAGLGIPHGARQDAHRIVTASVGVATLVPSPGQPVVLLRDAEAALERAFSCGRDAVCHATLDKDA